MSLALTQQPRTLWTSRCVKVHVEEPIQNPGARPHSHAAPTCPPSLSQCRVYVCNGGVRVCPYVYKWACMGCACVCACVWGAVCVYMWGGTSWQEAQDGLAVVSVPHRPPSPNPILGRCVAALALFLLEAAVRGGCKMYTPGHRHLWAPDKGGSSGVGAEWPAVRATGGVLSGDCHSHPIAREEWEAGARVAYRW